MRVKENNNAIKHIKMCSGRVLDSLMIDRTRVQLSPGPLQATLSKLLTYCVLRPTQPPTLTEMENE